MSTALVEWTAPESRLPTAATLLPVVFEETRRRPVFLAAIFAAIALGALFFGLTLSKNYSSTTTIMVDENTLATGKSAANAEVVDRAAIAREVAFSRKVMREVLKAGGWMDSHPSALEQEQLIKKIAQNTEITSSKQLPNVVRVSYTDSSPLRAYRVTGKLGEMIIEESLAARASQARSAYEFISGQVSRYSTRLRDAEAKLAAFRKANPDARAGSDEDVVRRIAELRRAVDDARMDLLDAQAQEGAMRSALSRQSPLGMMQSRGSQMQVQMAELVAERNRLLLSYTDQHPDVVRINSQIRDLQNGVRSSAASETTLVVPKGASTGGTLNPAYGELSTRVADARGRGAASASRIALGQQLLQEEMARSDRVAEASGEMSDLTRDYEVNRDVYKDLLKRRENAQVAMDMDTSKKGLTFRVLEPAAIPLQPSGGLRLVHVAGIGLFLAVIAPLLFLLGMLRMDNRVRSPAQVEQLAGLPVLGTIPMQNTQSRRAESRHKLRLACLLVLVVPVAYGLALSARWILAQ
ncbi:XrtA system polysaccharide chain length determinant [Lysobacter niastensis]|uniref:Polysaccharide chain length determinant N-terminal domain-containing protein n=1 Tax=Lysobacter niastensis TaxID=380629 RepID=A0ABS0B5W2_9GAMM|nr:XrtA system polysaccharide chain length determinant [Lysobacter niastensis]MBF6024316.1 hypothetical protein [Lysobacter niastensis]